MPSNTFPSDLASKVTRHTVKEEQIEYGFIDKLQGLKYVYREDIRDRAALEQNFREKFENLNRVNLSKGEFKRLLDEIVTPDVFTAARRLRERSAFKRQNQLTQAHIDKIVKTYQFREEEARYSRRVDMVEIEKNDFNLNISRYISTAVAEEQINLNEVNEILHAIEKDIVAAKAKHNQFLKELGLPLLP